MARAMAMAENERDEVKAMEARERRRWLTVAAAHDLRKEWEETRVVIDRLVEEFNKEDEDEQAASLFIVLVALTYKTYTDSLREAAQKLQRLKSS